MFYHDMDELHAIVVVVVVVAVVVVVVAVAGLLFVGVVVAARTSD
jgi:hypothetical protein